MDSIIDDLVAIEQRCSRGIALVDGKEFKQAHVGIAKASAKLAKSWSGSWFGYQSRVYYDQFAPPPPGAVFSREWGLSSVTFNPTRGEWREYSFEEVYEEGLRWAGNPDFSALEKAGEKATSIFEDCQQELLASLDAVLGEIEDKRLQKLRDEVEQIKPFLSAEDYARSESPKGTFRMSDHRAAEEGIRTPPHVALNGRAFSLYWRKTALEELGKVAKQARLYMEKRMSIKEKSMARTVGTVFIGHGRSPAWRDLKDLLQDRLKLKPDEFNMEAAAGLTTKERLEEMLDSAIFAFLVMTAEDEYADNTKHARENVIHEVGLFQGRLGFRRAIVLVEDGCAEFSNIQGLSQIRFPKGNIKAKSEEIRHVLEREGLIPGK